MGEHTTIEWCDRTFNPWIGCTKVSPACDHCYAEGWAKRSGLVTWGGPRRRTSAANWKLPLKWHAAIPDGQRQRVFCASLADVFDNEVPDEWRFDLFELIRQTPRLDWLLLTKRIGNAKRMLMQFGMEGSYNIWIGATVANQEEADRDIPKLLAVPARIRFLSIEPMLGPVNLHAIHESGPTEHGGQWDSWTSCLTGRQFDIHSDYETDGWPKVDWVIVGGESGHKARPCDLAWVRQLRDQCAGSGVAFFWKQHVVDGIKRSTPDLDGKRWTEFPEVKHGN